MKILIDKRKKVPVYLQIAEQIKEYIFDGAISDGYALPSERVLAADLGVHRNTVTKAYHELKAEGLLVASQGKDYRVARYADESSASRRKAVPPKPVNWEGIMKDEYAGFESEFDQLYSKSFDSGLISFGGGVAAREPYPPEEVAGTFEKLFREGGDKAYFYAPYQGDLELRRQIAAFLGTKGIKTDASHIQIFSENNQALDFILNLMLQPGDKVLMEETTSPDVFRTFEMAGVELISAPMDDNGMICENLDTIIEREKPAFIYTGSSFNNPTGTMLTVERKRKLLDLSYKYRIPIIEEDEASELYYDMVKSIVEKDIHPAECGLVFVANSGEEGLGNLKGVRKIMADYGKRTREFITLDHNTHGMVNSAVGSHRYKISVTSQGGHSFNAFGNSNALEVISQLVCELYKVNVPKKENSKTTYNVGVISGGTSVNTIAQSAEMLFEYRSDDFECLSYMKQRFDAVIEYISGLRSADGVQIKVELVGERPCGKGVDAAKQTALENRCREVYKRICNNDLTTESGSTDCNIPLSMGIPSICIGVGDGKGTHTREERLDLSTIEKGSNAAYEVIMGYFGK